MPVAGAGGNNFSIGLSRQAEDGAVPVFGRQTPAQSIPLKKLFAVSPLNRPLHQAGVLMPRVAVDQALAGPPVPVAQLQPGDLLFYHTDPTAPTYISHVAIYLGGDLMLQAPAPGLDVEIVPLVVGGGFAGAVRVYPRLAAAVAAVTPS